MKIKKLTVAAAMSFGLLAASVPAVLADAGELGAACPVGAPCAQPCAPCCAPCAPCQPACEVGDPCMATFLLPSRAYYSPMCQIPEENCPITGAAAELEGPYKATCPNYGCEIDHKKRQVYAYPSCSSCNETNTDALGCGCGCSGASPCSIPFGPLDLTTGGAAPVMTPGMPINAESGTQVQRKSEMQSSPFTIESPSKLHVLKSIVNPIPCCPTGAACPLPSQFSDVSACLWASDDINRLACAGVVAGYPDETFKPCNPVTRAEFAAMVVKGLNLDPCTPDFDQQIFTDVPKHHWANEAIDKAYNKGLVAGYPDNSFKPNQPVTKAEALTILSKALCCNISCEQAKCILSKYCDACSVPSWGTCDIAKSLDAGLISDFPNACAIEPCKDAQRAEIAAMIANLREVLAIDPCAAPQETGAAAELTQEIVAVPALKVKFNDKISSEMSQIGDSFKAETMENVTINGILFPAGSIVRGEIIEVVRPTRSDEGALKVAFKDIQYDDLQANLPREIITAQVQKSIKPNFFVRLFEFPFDLTGDLLGITGRTASSMFCSAANASEDIVKGLGLGIGEMLNGQFMAGGRSFLDSAVDTVVAPFSIAKDVVCGAAGVFNSTIDDVAYLTNVDGSKITSINPNEEVSVAFGCAACPVCECYECNPCGACPCDCVQPCPTCCDDPCQPACPCDPCNPCQSPTCPTCK